jgi:hypothetical protein
MAGRTVDDCLHALDVGLPGTIGTSVGVGNLDAEGHALIAELAFCHPLHLLAVIKSLPYWQAHDSLADGSKKSKYYFQKNEKNSEAESVAKRRRILYNKSNRKYQ